MKLVLMIVTVLWTISDTYSMIIKDPKIKPPKDEKVVSQEIMAPYKPYSLYVPSTNILAQLSPDRVLDLGATAYAANFPTKAIYFYTNAAVLFSENARIVAWANYETGFIYLNRRQKKKALEYFDKVIQMRNAPTTTQNLAKMMATRVRNEKEFKILQKQEDVLFLADQKAQSILNKQIAKEERIAEKSQRELTKERKRREKEEKRLLKEAEKKAKNKS